MEKLIFTLVVGGVIAGLVQFFVDFKKLPVSTDTQGFDSIEPPGLLTSFFQFLRDHWQFFAFIIIGIAGALLVPLINELTKGLPGIEEIKKYALEANKPGTAANEPQTWYVLVLLGYAIVFGYSAVKIIKVLGQTLLGNLSIALEQQQALLRETKQQLANVNAKLQSIPTLTSFNGNEHFTPHYDDDEAAQKELQETAGFDSCVENPMPKPWKVWRNAESLKTLLNQVNQLAPLRNKASDGTIGDLAHQGTSSDHNPWVWDTQAKKGIVTALDITNDPVQGCSCAAIAKSLEAGKDPRIKYVIWNKQIMSSAQTGAAQPWTWRSYSGANPHDKHIHISVKCDTELCDDTAAWSIKTT
jgi:hypothetical protein